MEIVLLDVFPYQIAKNKLSDKSFKEQVDLYMIQPSNKRVTLYITETYTHHVKN